VVSNLTKTELENLETIKEIHPIQSIETKCGANKSRETVDWVGVGVGGMLKARGRVKGGI
jgi:hypothetical protein